MLQPTQPAYLITAGTLVELHPARIERADLRIRDGKIISRGQRLRAAPGDQVIDAAGKLVLPGMVCAHTHLYSALARGMPAPARTPASFLETLQLVWWRLDRALDEETIYWSAVAGALDAVRAGTTCLFDHHASPNHISGSLGIVRDAVDAVGLRGVLCYEVTDRGGRRKRDAGLQENREFAQRIRAEVARVFRDPATGTPGADPRAAGSQNRFRALIGAHAPFTLSDESLEACAAIMRETSAGLHIHVAEDQTDAQDARRKYRRSVVERLARAGALTPQTILAHGVHLNARDIAIARETGVWFAHNPRSNMNNQVGYAPVERFGDRLVMGTDGIAADMFDEARFAFFKGRDSRNGLGAAEWLDVLANNHRLASDTFGVEIGPLRPGAAADLLIMDYQSPTPLTAANLPWHLAFGITSVSIESVMVAGHFIIHQRRPAYAESELYGKARQAAEMVWRKLKRLR